MKLALISPTCMLEKFATQSDGIHLVLVHMIQKDHVYTEFYRKRAEAGDTIILDNGAYEFGEPATTIEIAEAAKRVQATTVVAPDYPGKHWRKTYDAFRAFHDDLPEPFKILGIPQSEIGSVSTWERCFTDMLDFEGGGRLSHIGMSILACPNAFQQQTGTKDIELNRFVATAKIRWVQSMLDGVKVHYFGFGARAYLLPYYRGFGNSMDTKGPIKAGLNGQALWGGVLPRGTKDPLDLSANYELTIPQAETIQRNIDELKNWMQREQVV